MQDDIKERAAAEDSYRVVLVGNPNVGKSAIFGALTGNYVCVSNYPGTTVEVCHGTATLNRRKTDVVDTPGANSLTPMSEDERVTRDILLDDQPCSVVQVADAKNLRRAIALSTQLAEMDLPFLLVLNMADEARSRGIRINSTVLSQTLGVPVVSTIATQKRGLDRLVANLPYADRSKYRVRFDHHVESAVEEIGKLMNGAIRGERAIALTILSGDESIAEWLHTKLDEPTIAAIDGVRQNLQTKYQQPLGYVINLQRLRAIEKLIRTVETSDRREVAIAKKRSRIRRLNPIITVSVFALAAFGISLLAAIHPLFALLSVPLLLLAVYTLGDWGMHPVFGLPILAVILFIVWMFVGDFGAGICVDFLQDKIFGEYINPAATWVSDKLLPWQFAKDLLIGEYGIITMALTYALAIVLPIVGTFFIAFGMLEDSGYLPRLAVMVDKLFKKMGLNGKAVLPMVLGLGCDTMATLTARILDTKRERIIVTLLLALGVPCSAQLGVILGMLGSPGVPIGATIIWIGVVIVVLFKVGFLAGMLMPGEKTDFILEVPPTRMPQLENIVIKTLARVEWYVKEAVPLFVLGTLVLFFADRLKLLALTEKIAAPVVQGFLQLPAKATQAFIIGFLRRDYGVAGFYEMTKANQMDTVQVIVSLVTITLFVPCLANFLVIIKERGIKTAIAMSLFIVPYAFLVGGVLNWVLRSVGAFQ